MKGSPEYAIKIHDGKGYPYNPSEAALDYLKQLRTNGVYLIDADVPLADGTILEFEQWEVIEQTRFKGRDNWEYYGEHFPFEPIMPEPGWVYRTVYILK